MTAVSAYAYEDFVGAICLNYIVGAIAFPQHFRPDFKFLPLQHVSSLILFYKC